MMFNVYDFDVKCTRCKASNFQRVHRNKIERVFGKKRKYHCKECNKTFYA